MRFFCLLAVSLFCAAPPGMAQLSQLKNAVEGAQPPKAAEPEKPADTRKRLEGWLHEARVTLAKMENAGSVELPAGVSPAEKDARRRDLEQMVLVTTSYLKNLGSVDDARKELERARAEDAGWSGFAEPPPYSILMVDELRNERDAVKAKLTSHESSLANYERLLASILTEAKGSEEAVNSSIATVQSAPAEMQDAAKWRLETARAKARLMAVRAGFLQTSCEALKNRIAATKTSLALVERKIAAAAPKARFNEEDLASIRKISSEHQQALHKEQAAIAKRLNSALSARNRAQAAVETAAPEGAELAKFRLESAEVRLEALQALTEGVESLVQLENIEVKAYEDRHAILKAKDGAERAKGLESLTTVADRMRAWLNVLENESATCSAEIGKLEARAASISTDDPRFAPLSEQRAALAEKQAMLQRANQAVTMQRKLIRRWIADFTPKEEDVGFLQRASEFASRAWGGVRKVWSFEVMSFEEKVDVGGQTLVGKIPVTLGMLLRAILFFLIGFLIASRIANRIQRGVIARGHVAEAQARTLRNWAMIVVGVLLAIGTLAFLKIPLTIFAFLGGALVIGLGFGTQTLIKNFISGIIVLAERKVRVGDILDVDGIVGTVTEVNTRSSVIRSPDDVETMIPNAMFLENRVTNWTLSHGRQRRNVRVGVAYGSDPRQVIDILVECAGRHGLVCKEPPPFAIFDDFADSALMFTLYFWVDLNGPASPIILASDLRLMIDKRLHEAGIGIPFPQRDMHLTTSTPLAVRVIHDNG